MNRYMTNTFCTQLFYVVGVEFLNKDLELDGHFVTMWIWDTADQEQFRNLRTPFTEVLSAACSLLVPWLLKLSELE